MLLADQERTCDALRRDRRACREAYANQSRTLAERAALEQRIAELQDEELRLLAGLADCADGLKHRLFEILINIAQRGRLRGDARQQNAQAVEEWASSREAPLENEARTFVSECAKGVAFCQEGIVESLESEDLHAARVYCEQAGRIITAMREIQDGWPWSNPAAVDESRRQYERGELMDFETFKHELLKAAQ